MIIRSFALMLAVHAAAGASRLSGVWHPDPAASSARKTIKDEASGQTRPAPPAPPPGAPIHTVERIEVEGADVVLSNLSPAGEVISTLRLRTDGTKSVNELAGGALIHESRSLWEGGGLATEWEMRRKDGERVTGGSDTRRLSEDGETPTLDRSVEDARSRSSLPRPGCAMRRLRTARSRTPGRGAPCTSS